MHTCRARGGMLTYPSTPDMQRVVPVPHMLGNNLPRYPTGRGHGESRIFCLQRWVPAALVPPKRQRWPSVPWSTQSGGEAERWPSVLWSTQSGGKLPERGAFQRAGGEAPNSTACGARKYPKWNKGGPGEHGDSREGRHLCPPPVRLFPDSTPGTALQGQVFGFFKRIGVSRFSCELSRLGQCGKADRIWRWSGKASPGRGQLGASREASAPRYGGGGLGRTVVGGGGGGLITCLVHRGNEPAYPSVNKVWSFGVPTHCPSGHKHHAPRRPAFAIRDSRRRGSRCGEGGLFGVRWGAEWGLPIR